MSSSVLLRRLHACLLAVIVLALAMHVRSLLHGRLVTMFLGLLLVWGANLTLAGRTWGVGLLLATAASFPAAHLLGMGPAWFWLVGAIGAAPFVVAWRPMARFDRGAAVLLASMSVASGVTFAFATRELGPALLRLYYSCP